MKRLIAALFVSSLLASASFADDSTTPAPNKGNGHQKLKEKLAKMTPEERKAFIAKLKHRKHHHHKGTQPGGTKPGSGSESNSGSNPSGTTPKQ